MTPDFRPPRRTTPINRDSQKRRVYNAEDSLPERYNPRLTEQEGQRFLDQVLARGYVRRNYVALPVILEWMRGDSAWALGQRIKCSDNSRTKLVLLHELAHILDNREERRFAKQVGQSHGWRFCAIYLDLVRNVLGEQLARNLRAAMKARRVRHRAPRKGRQLTIEERAVLVGRLTLARAAKAAKEG